MADMKWVREAWREDSRDLARVVELYEAGQWRELFAQLAWFDSVIELLRADGVEQLVIRGSSWQEIGDQLGVSKQAAWARYRWLRGGDRDPEVQAEIDTANLD